jgi:hypothetical protein
MRGCVFTWSYQKPSDADGVHVWKVDLFLPADIVGQPKIILLKYLKFSLKFLNS